jgi:hypothetical protein
MQQARKEPEKCPRLSETRAFSYEQLSEIEEREKKCKEAGCDAESISGRTMTAETIAEAIDAELVEYTKWVNGDVYAFTLYDENGEQVDSCGGFFDIEDIREHLPEDWKDEPLMPYLKA